MYSKILVPLDGSPVSECVLPHAESIARGCGTTEVILFQVCEPPVLLADYPAGLRSGWEEHVRQETDHIQEQCRLYLEGAAQKLRDAGVRVTVETGLGKPAEQILDYSVRIRADIIIMASHGHSGITRWAHGNTAWKVIQASRVPVLLVKPEG